MVNKQSFDNHNNPRDVVSTSFFTDGVQPLYVSSYEGSERFADEFLAGCKALGFEPTPQQWKIAGALNAWDEIKDRHMFGTVGVCIPRRAGKTTALLAVALGRLLCRPGYAVMFTAQSGTKASARFLDMARALERVNPDPDTRGFRILRGAGNQNLTFANGSHFQLLPPKPDSMRGDAYDMLILDEAQEHDAADSAELLGAILPTMDTRPGAQLVVAGTAGLNRSGLFWDTLEDGRNKANGVGIVEFAARQDTTAEEAADPALWQAAHPGIGTLTTLEIVEQRFEKLPLPQFMREYLGIFPEDYSRSAIDMEAWGQCETEFVDKPGRFALAYDVAIDGSSAAIAVAWRTDSNAFVEIVEHKPGVDWLVPRLQQMAQKYRVPIAHDTVGAALVEAEALQRLRPRPKLQPLAYRDLSPGCAQFMKEVNERTIRHFGQPSLTEAARNVVKRPLGEHGFAWGRRQSEGDITPLVAATFALRAFDNGKPAAKTFIITS